MNEFLKKNIQTKEYILNEYIKLFISVWKQIVHPIGSLVVL